MLYIQCLPFDSLFLLEAEDCKDKITLNEGFLAFCIAIKYCVTLITVLCVCFLKLRAAISFTISGWKKCSVRLYLQWFVRGLMSYVRYLCLLAHSGVQHILCCVFVLFFLVLCTLYCQFRWIVHFFYCPFSVL